MKVDFTKESSQNTLVGSIDVTNIYRKLQIQVQSYVSNNGRKSQQTGYKPVWTGSGAPYAGNYGLPWDLNGYNADDLTSGSLVENPTLGFDTVPIVFRELR